MCVCVVYCVLVCVCADKRRENCIAKRSCLRAESALKIIVSFLAFELKFFGDTKPLFCLFIHAAFVYFYRA